MKKVLEVFSKYYITFLVYALLGWLYEVFWMWFVVPPKHFVNRGVLLGPFLPIYGFGALILLLCLHKFMKNKHTLENNLNYFIATTTVTTFVYTTVIEYTTTPKIHHVGDYLRDYGIWLLIANLVSLIIVLILREKSKKIRDIDVTIIMSFLYIWLITTALEYISHFVMDKCFGVMLWDYTKDFLNVYKRVNWDASRNFAIGGTVFLYVIQPLITKFLNKTSEKTKITIALVIFIPMVLDFIFHVILKLI